MIEQLPLLLEGQINDFSFINIPPHPLFSDKIVRQFLFSSRKHVNKISCKKKNVRPVVRAACNSRFNWYTAKFYVKNHISLEVKFTYYYESYLSTTVVISVCPYYKDFLFFLI